MFAMFRILRPNVRYVSNPTSQCSLCFKSYVPMFTMFQILRPNDHYVSNPTSQCSPCFKCCVLMFTMFQIPIIASFHQPIISSSHHHVTSSLHLVLSTSHPLINQTHPHPHQPSTHRPPFQFLPLPGLAECAKRLNPACDLRGRPTPCWTYVRVIQCSQCLA